MLGQSTIVLNMIVKNEAGVIRRCLESVIPLIDHWVIVDTGSTDGTQDIVKDTMRDVPGELLERPWVNFGHNRTEALRLADGRADYILIIDADDTLLIDQGFTKPRLSSDAYYVDHRRGPLVYGILHLVRSGLDWRYVGVLHEYIHSPHPHATERLAGLTVTGESAGARARDPLTYRRDALILEQGLLDEPDNSRYVFYLAQSYRDSGDLDLAIRNYQRRAGMGGWEEEVFAALYQHAACRERRGDPWPEVMAAYLESHRFRPSRLEPLYWIGMHYINAKDWANGMLFMRRAMDLAAAPMHDILFVQHDLYRYWTAVQLSVCSYWLGDKEECLRLSEQLLARRDLGEEVARLATFNRDLVLRELGRAAA